MSTIVGPIQEYVLLATHNAGDKISANQYLTVALNDANNVFYYQSIFDTLTGAPKSFFARRGDKLIFTITHASPPGHIETVELRHVVTGQTATIVPDQDTATSPYTIEVVIELPYPEEEDVWDVARWEPKFSRPLNERLSNPEQRDKYQSNLFQGLLDLKGGIAQQLQDIWGALGTFVNNVVVVKNDSTSGTITAGTPLRPSSSTNYYTLVYGAYADSTANCAILVAMENIADNEFGKAARVGPVTRGDWTSLTGSTYLTRGAQYYLSQSNPGNLYGSALTTTVPDPATGEVQYVGVAVDRSTLWVDLRNPSNPAELKGPIPVDLLDGLTGGMTAGRYLRAADADTLEERTAAQVRADLGAPDISGTPNAGDYARWADGDTLEARTTAQVLSDIGAAAASDLSAHLSDTSDAHDASAISVVPAGTIAATDVQAALEELDTEKATAAQGALADSATQPGDSVTTLNMATARILGRTTAGSGAVEEITVGSGLSLSAGTLTASASAPALDDLTDVVVTTPADKHALMYDGAVDNRWENRALVLADISDAGTAAAAATGDFATAAQGALADSATQPGDLATTLNVSATDKILGRATAGAGAVEEITCTAAGRALLDDADAAAQRTTLGLGTAATSASGDFAASSHTHPASDIASGQVALARGGTGSDLSATGGTSQYLKQATLGGAVTVGTIAAADLPTGIDATKIGGGAVDNTEFGYLNGVTSAIQAQIDGKAASSHTHAASDITSGTLAHERGGLEADISAIVKGDLIVGTGTGTAGLKNVGTDGHVLTADSTAAGGIKWAAASASSGPPAGTILAYGASSPPTGYLACDGSAVSRTTYATLFGVLGTTWGAGDGSTTFNLPDLRGRAPIGSGTGSGLTARTLATNYGSENTTLTAAQSGLPSHTHSITVFGESANATGGANYAANPSAGSTGAAGGTSASSSHSNLQPSVAVKFIIKT